MSAMVVMSSATTLMIKAKEMHDDTNNPLGPTRRSTNMAAAVMAGCLGEATHQRFSGLYRVSRPLGYFSEFLLDIKDSLNVIPGAGKVSTARGKICK